MSTQYLRNLSVVVSDPSGTGLDLGALRCVFRITRGDTSTPNTCDVTVYNLSANTAAKLRYRGVNEFTRLTLSVSYGTEPVKLLFTGSIKQVRSGREDQLNSYVAITAADGDEAYNFAPAAFAMAAGVTAEGTVEALIAQMALAAAGSPTGGSGGQVVTQGYMPTLSQKKSLRGKVVYGLCRDEMTKVARNNDCTWSVQDGKAVFVPLTGYIPGAPVLITPSTGLLGVPEQTQNGLELRVLMNPNIKIGQTIKLDSTDVNELRFGLDNQSVSQNLTLQQGAAKLNGDGLYYVMRAEHFGDTRGEAWYTDLICLAVDIEVPDSALATAIIPADAIPRY